MISSETRYSEYDVFARIYNEDWGPRHSNNALPPLEKLLLPYLPNGTILDLCCGTGQLVQQLVVKGYQVTGLDGSEAMLSYARDNVPEAQFILSDARFFELPSSFDAVVSTSASFNHVINLEELKLVFQNVYAALRANGLFVFDMNLEERYQSTLWNGYMQGDIKDDYAWAMKQRYCPDEKIGQIQTTTFQLIEGNWHRRDSSWLVKGYSQSDIQSLLENVGFREISVYDAERDFAIHGKAGNAYFACRK